jgi:hypothetical protein
VTITSAIERTRGWLLVSMTGAITCDAIRAHLLEERATRYLAHRELIDATAATIDFSPAQVREIVLLLRELGQRDQLGPTAVVVGSDYSFGMMRMLQILLNDQPAVYPFRSRLEAEAWLAQAPAYGSQLESAK